MSNNIASNKQAFRDYEVLETAEAGIELRGSEVKSLREGRINLGDSFARINENFEVFLYNTHISQYTQASYLNADSMRVRKLLLHKREIKKLHAKLTQKGLTLVPLKMYFNSRGFVKVEIALCKGKKDYDRRDDIKKREVDMKIRKMMRNRR